ncbi:MAG: cupredoxin domain-containing protein, partial [Chloroflexota bacterium]
LLRLVGVVVVGFALLNFTAGLRLAGVGLPWAGGAAVVAAPAAAQIVDGVQALQTRQDADGYSPEAVTIYAGTPTRWTITSSTTATCAASLVVPDLDIFQRLNEGDNVIQLPAMRAGTLRYSCAMGMYGGEIRIVERPTGTTGQGSGG